jgi:pyridoxamine 5'-phosphate oxidase family protein
MFTEKELGYLVRHQMARIATVSDTGQPDVAPVTFGFDGIRFTIGGSDITHTFKYKNVKSGHCQVALVIDDLESVTPWKTRGIKVHGTAAIIEEAGKIYLAITPVQHWSWGIDEPAFVQGKSTSRKEKHAGMDETL